MICLFGNILHLEQANNKVDNKARQHRQINAGRNWKKKCNKIQQKRVKIFKKDKNNIKTYMGRWKVEGNKMNWNERYIEML